MLRELRVKFPPEGKMGGAGRCLGMRKEGKRDIGVNAL